MKKPRGTQDILPSEVYKWHYVESTFRDVCRRFGYEEIRTPLFEYTNLFKRGVGETTDVVSKEMYTVFNSREYTNYIAKRELMDAPPLDVMRDFMNDKNGMTLKPEGTAPVARAFVESKMYAESQPTKLYYITACSRHERPQAGRLRQFHQFGVEIFSAYGASADAETIAVADTFMRELGLENVVLNINSVGCPECRPKYHEVLKDFLASKLDNLCETCNERYEKNPLRILDCKNKSCQAELVEAPVMLDHLCDDCEDHFGKLKTYLQAMDIDFVIDPKIVRGLDYYTKTAFEFISGEIGAQSTVCGGGRYNKLVAEIGGPETPGVGFGMGIERLIMTLEANGVTFPDPNTDDLFIVSMGEDTIAPAVGLTQKLRRKGISADTDHMGRKMKAQMKFADKINAKYTLVLGSNEIESGNARIKHMATGEQTDIQLGDLDSIVKIITE